MWELRYRAERAAAEAEALEKERLAGELGMSLRLFKEMILFLDIKQGAAKAGLLTEEENLPCHWLNPKTREVEETKLSEVLAQTESPQQALVCIKKAVDLEPKGYEEYWGDLKKAASELHNPQKFQELWDLQID